MKILVVEDDHQISRVLQATLKQHLYSVDVAFDGQAGWELTETIKYDLILLDVMLPKLDGISFCKRLRDRGCQTLVMMITSRSTVADRVLGLNSGADDYVIKPFAMPELEARIQTLLRRRAFATLPILQWGKLQIDRRACEVTYDRTRLELTPKELSLLELLLDGQVYSQSAIVDQLWSLEEEPPREDAVRAHIKRLRQKLKLVEAQELIETVYGQGYRLNPQFRQVELLSSTEAQPSLTTAPRLQRSQILVVTSDQEFLDLIAQEAPNYAIQMVTATNGVIAQLQIRNQRPDLIVLAHEFGLPEPLTQGIPILLLANLHSDLTAIPDHIRGILYQPITPAQLLESCLDCLEPSQALTQRVMVIDDDQMIVRLLKSILEEYGMQVNPITNPLRIWEELESFAPDLLILDVQMPHINGIRLCEAIRNDLRWSWLPILFLTSLQDLGTIQEIFTAGADDYISKPIVAPDLLDRVSRRLTRMQHIRHQADFDPLTSLPTQQRSRRMLKRLLHLAHQNQQSMCFAVLEVKDLKQINQQYGYRYGNQVLQHISAALRQAFRKEDIIARWNGAEFIVGAYNLARSDAVDWLAQVLESLQDAELRSPVGIIAIAFSAAVAQYPDNGLEVQSLYQCAIATLKNPEHRDRVLPVDWQSSDVEVVLLHRNSKFAQDVMRSLFVRGYQSQWFQDSRSALEGLRTEAPAQKRVLLLEAKLPGLNGTASLRHLIKEQEGISTILLSTQAQEAEKVMELGCLDYVTIPCPIPTLMQTVQKAYCSVSSKS